MAVKQFFVKKRYPPSDDDLCASLSDSSDTSTIFETTSKMPLVSSTPFQKRDRTVRPVRPLEFPSWRLSVVPKSGHNVDEISSAAVPEEHMKKKEALLEDIPTNNNKSLDSPLLKRHRNSERNGEEETPLKIKRLSAEQDDLPATNKIIYRPSVLFYHQRIHTAYVPDYEIVPSDEDEENKRNNNKNSPIKNKEISEISQNQDNSPSTSLSEQKINNKIIATVSPSKKSENIQTNNVDFEIGADTDTGINNVFTSGVHKAFKNVSTPNSSDARTKIHARQSIRAEQSKTIHSSCDNETDEPISKNRNSVEKKTVQVYKKLAKNVNKIIKFQELPEDGVVACTEYENNVVTQKRDNNEKVVLNRKKHKMNEQKSENTRKKQLQIEPNIQLLKNKSLDTGNTGHASNENPNNDESDKTDIRTSSRNRFKPLQYWLSERLEYSYTDTLGPTIVGKTEPVLSDILSTNIDNGNYTKKQQMDKINKKIRSVKKDNIKQMSYDKTDTHSGSKTVNAKKSTLMVNSNRSEIAENLNNSELRIIEKSTGLQKKGSKRKKQMENFDEQRNKRIPEKNKNESTLSNIRKSKRVHRKPRDYWLTEYNELAPITSKTNPKWLEKVLAECENGSTMVSSKASRVSNQQLTGQNEVANADRNGETNNLFSGNKKPMEKGKKSSPVVKKVLSTKHMKKTFKSPKIVKELRPNRKGESSKSPQKTKKNYPLDAINSYENASSNANVGAYAHAEKLSANQSDKTLGRTKNPKKMKVNHRSDSVNYNENAECDEDVNGGLFSDGQEKNSSANQPEKKRGRIENQPKMTTRSRSDAVNFNENAECNEDVNRGLFLDEQKKNLNANQHEKKRGKPKNQPKMTTHSRSDAVNYNENAECDEDVNGGLFSDGQEKNSSANQPEKKRGRIENQPKMTTRSRSDAVNYNENAECNEDVNRGLFFDEQKKNLNANQHEKKRGKPKNQPKMTTHSRSDAVNYNENTEYDGGLFLDGQEKNSNSNQPEKKRGRIENQPKITTRSRSDAVNYNENAECNEAVNRGLFLDGQKKNLNANQPEKKRRKPKNLPKMTTHSRSDAVNYNENTECDGGLFLDGQEKNSSANQPEKKRGRIENQPKMTTRSRSDAVNFNENAECNEDVNRGLFLDGQKKNLNANQPEKKRRKPKNLPKMTTHSRSDAVNYNENTECDGGLFLDGQEKNSSANQPEKKRVRIENQPKMTIRSRSDAVNFNENAECNEDVNGGLFLDGREKNSSANQPEKKRGRIENQPKITRSRSAAVNYNANAECNEDVNGGLFLNGQKKNLNANQPEKKRRKPKNQPKMTTRSRPNAVNYNEKENPNNDVGVHEDIKKTLKEKSNQKKKTENHLPNIQIGNLESDDKDTETKLEEKHKTENETRAQTVLPEYVKFFKDVRYLQVANGLFLSDCTRCPKMVTRFLRINSKSVKSRTIPKKSNKVFLVLSGTVKFEIFESTIIASKGDQVKVPQFMPYSILNTSSTEEAVLYNMAVEP